MGTRKLLPSPVGPRPQAAGAPSPAVQTAGSASAQGTCPGNIDGSLLAGGGGFRDPLRVYLESLAAGGQASARSALTQVAGLLRTDLLRVDWAAIEPGTMLGLRARLRERYAPSTANKVLSTLRGLLRTCWRLELLTHEQLQRLVDVPRVRGTREPRGRALDPADLACVLRACDQRDRTLVVLMVSVGLRVSEAAGLAWENWNAEARELQVVGKGNKQRTVPLTDQAQCALEDWGRGRTLTGPVFGVGVRAIQKMLARRAAAANVPPFTAHDLRRTFVSALLDSGADLAVAQQLAGHADPRTTSGYDRRPAAARRAAIERLGLL